MGKYQRVTYSQKRQLEDWLRQNDDRLRGLKITDELASELVSRELGFTVSKNVLTGMRHTLGIEPWTPRGVKKEEPPAGDARCLEERLAWACQAIVKLTADCITSGVKVSPELRSSLRHLMETDAPPARPTLPLFDEAGQAACAAAEEATAVAAR